MIVTKVVVLVLRIPEQLSLYLFDFSTILYVFYKFAVLKFMYILHFSPCNFVSSPQESLGGLNRTEEGNGGRIPASFLAGSEGKVGEKDEELESYLWVAVARRERV